jgi:hypothetical protein
MLIVKIIIIKIFTGRKINSSIEGLWCGGPQKHVEGLSAVEFILLLLLVVVVVVVVAAAAVVIVVVLIIPTQLHVTANL